jgi:hypothetical protein
MLAGALAAGLVLSRRGDPEGPPAGAVGSSRLRLLVPAYIYPSGDGARQWGRLLNSPAAAATVVVVNPASGPGAAVDPNYAKVLERASHGSVTAVGYVSTNYAARPLQEVKDEVDRWARLYPGIRGVFFDQQASAADRVDYYVALYEHAKGRGLALVVSNPGTVCAEDYLDRPAADVVCLLEGAKNLSAYRRPAWTDRYPAERFAALLYDVGPVAQMRGHLLEMQENRIGYCFITDGKLPNPWGQLPRYWEHEVRAVQQLNAP